MNDAGSTAATAAEAVAADTDNSSAYTVFDVTAVFDVTNTVCDSTVRPMLAKITMLAIIAHPSRHTRRVMHIDELKLYI